MSVGEVVLGAFLQVILQNLSSLIIKSKATASDHELEADLEKLKESLELIREVLGDAEKSQVRKHDVKRWLCHLRDVAHDANDVLDEINTEGLRRDSVHFREVRETRAYNYVNPKRRILKHEVETTVRRIIRKIEDIRKNNIGLRLAEGGGRPSSADDRDIDKPTTGILSTEAPVFGRLHETANVVELLITDEYSDKHISVIPIQGIGGIGKTILAQVVYNHEDVLRHFDRKMWVHVPYISDVTRLTKLILESVAGPTNLSGLNSLQDELVRWLMGTKYLLVLDNMWNERSEDWNGISEDWVELQKPLFHGARGSRILITTRSPTTAKISSTIGHPLVLHGLPYEDCWSVFAHHAFEDPGECARRGNLVVIGKEIVKKCSGSPLAARTLGSHLRAAESQTWQKFKRSEILHLSESRDGILRSLESTYHQILPPHLKQCFRFCAIFPKDFKFEKDVLVRLWMAQGFILPKAPPNVPHVERVEDIGAEYFDSLVDRLFFRRDDDDPSRYVMCDLISELARFVSHDECCMFEHCKPCKVVESIRHSSLFCDHSNQEASSSSSSPSSSKRQPAATIESLYETKGLYTLLLLGESRHCSMQIPSKMVEKLIRLRTLDLGNLDIERLNDSIKELKHLRYLNLSSTRIKGLPESLCSLYNLQTLGLRNCTRLEKLPRDIKYLCNLRHLDLHLDDDFHKETVNVLSSMPRDIGKLQNLQTLSKFVVGKGRNCGGIAELRNLNDIHGDLRLLNLHNIDTEHEATEAKLSDKKYLTRLELQWGDNHSSKQHNRREETVLANLRAHTNLTELWIAGYNGASFPPWICDYSFSNLVKFRLSNCRECKRLPPLGLLPSLRDVCIKGMDGVEYVDCGFCRGSNVGAGFRSLRKLHFENMRNWKEWHGAETCTLPSLRELVIKDCPRLGTIIHSFPTETQVFFP